MNERHALRSLKLAVDVDDVLLDLVTAWLNRYNDEYKDNLEAEDITDWNLLKYVKPECGEKIYDFLTPSIYEEVLPLPEAAEFVARLRENHYITYATSCGYSQVSKEYLEAKQLCLSQYDISRPEDEWFPVAGGIESKNRAPCHLLIDDRIENIRAWHESGRYGLLFSRPWNRLIVDPQVRRLRRLDEIADVVDTYSQHIGDSEFLKVLSFDPTKT
jgi:5'(3')-deoxyribonucleotidase